MKNLILALSLAMAFIFQGYSQTTSTDPKKVQTRSAEQNS